MAAYNDYSDDPSQQDWQDQLRQQILAQQAGGDDRNYMGGSPTFDEAAPQGMPAPVAPAPFLAGDTVTRATTPAPATADPSLLGPNYSGPAPASFGGPATSADQVPVPGVNPGVVYTDQAGKGYTPDQLYAQRNTLLQDPINARIRDILQTYGYGGAQAAAATPAAPNSGGGGTAMAGGSSAGAYGLSNGWATMPSAADPNQAWKESIRKIILSRLQADQGPVDPNAPEIQAAMNASKDAYTRQNQTERDALAERLYAQGGGLNTDAITQQIQQSNERTGTAQSQLHAQLLMSAYKDKFTELNHLLDLATQSGNVEQAQQIQVTLANLQAALAREGLGVNLAEFGAQLDQNTVLAGLR